MADLFSDAAAQRAGEVAPLALRLRPRTLDELVGQTHVLGEGSALRLIKDAVYFGLTAAALPFALIEAASGAGSTVMIEARPRSS